MGNTALNYHFLMELKNEHYGIFEKNIESGYLLQVKGSKWTSYYDANNEGDIDSTKEIALNLSKELGAKALVFDIYDSDVFSYYLISNGQVVDHYNSNPNYFDGGEDIVDYEENAKKLCATLGINQCLQEVTDTLGKSYVFEDERVEALAEILGINPVVASSGYDDAEDIQDYLEEEITVKEIG